MRVEAQLHLTPATQVYDVHPEEAVSLAILLLPHAEWVTIGGYRYTEESP